MRRMIAAIVMTTSLFALPGCGSGTSNPPAQAQRPLTIDGVDLTLTRRGLAFTDVTGEYIDNDAYAERITQIGAVRAVYFRIGGADQTPVTIVQFDPTSQQAMQAYIAAQRAKLGIADESQSQKPGDPSASPTEFISTAGKPTGPQWQIKTRRNLVIIGDASSDAWQTALKTLKGM